MEQDVEVALDIQRGGRMYERYRDVPVVPGTSQITKLVIVPHVSLMYKGCKRYSIVSLVPIILLILTVPLVLAPVPHTPSAPCSKCALIVTLVTLVPLYQLLLMYKACKILGYKRYNRGVDPPIVSLSYLL